MTPWSVTTLAITEGTNQHKQQSAVKNLILCWLLEVGIKISVLLRIGIWFKNWKNDLFGEYLLKFFFYSTLSI